MTFRYQAVVVKEGKGYWAHIPCLKGVYGNGRSESAAKKDLQEALQLCLEVRRDIQKLPPRPHDRARSRNEVTAMV